MQFIRHVGLKVLNVYFLPVGILPFDKVIAVQQHFIFRAQYFVKGEILLAFFVLDAHGLHHGYCQLFYFLGGGVRQLLPRQHFHDGINEFVFALKAHLVQIVVGNAVVPVYDHQNFSGGRRPFPLQKVVLRLYKRGIVHHLRPCSGAFHHAFVQARHIVALQHLL